MEKESRKWLENKKASLVVPIVATFISSMLGDDEVPETCSQCDVYYDDGKPVYNHKPIDDDSIEPNKECSQCDVE